MLRKNMIFNEARRLQEGHTDHALRIDDLPLAIFVLEDVVMMQVAMQQILGRACWVNFSEEFICASHEGHQAKIWSELQASGFDRFRNPLAIGRQSVGLIDWNRKLGDQFGADLELRSSNNKRSQVVARRDSL